MFRYVHTNIIAKDSKKLIAFYKKVMEMTILLLKYFLMKRWRPMADLK